MNKDILVSVSTIIDDDSDFVFEYLQEVTSVLSQHYENYEVILIGNGISIQTSVEVRKIIQKFPNVRLIQLANHYDEDIAYSSALDAAIGDAVVLIDSRWDPCDIIPKMVEKISQEKVDVVIGINLDKNPETYWHDFLARCFYKVAGYMCAQSVDFDRTHYSCYSRTAVNSITQYKNHIRNLRLLRKLLGVETAVIEYYRANRGQKNRKTNIVNRLFSRVEEVLSLSVKPLRIVSAICLFAGCINVVYLVYVILIRVVGKGIMPGWASLSVTQGSMFTIFFFTLGVIANYINIIFREVQQRPLYVILNEWSSGTPLEYFLRKNVVE